MPLPLAEIAAALGQLLAPLLKAVFPLILDELKRGPGAKRVKATKEDRRKNLEDWRAWNEGLCGVVVPDDYPFRVLP